MPTLLPMALALLAWADPPLGPTPTASPLDVVSALESVLGDAIARAEPSVVAIARVKSDNDETLAVRGRNVGRGLPPERRAGFGAIVQGDGFDAETLSSDFGSGVVVGDKGEVLTAFHVVKGAKALHVWAENRQAFDAEIIAADPRSDLAVLVPRESPGLPAPKLKAMAIGDASKLRKGAFLVALGNPFNTARDGRPSASWGILSNRARRIEQPFQEWSNKEVQLRNLPTLLQLDSKLNLGMSGGAVINLKGELVGLTTAAANAAGFDAQAGYAIPMDALGRRIVETLKQGKEYEYGFLGIKLDNVEGTNRVLSATPGTPAALGGVQVGDAVAAVGDLPVTDADSLVVAINSIPAGEPVTLKLVRRNRTIERTVRLAKYRIRSSPVIATNRPTPWRGLRVDYSSTIADPPFGTEILDAMSREGVIVSEVETGSEAEKSGLKPGQLVTRVDGQPVRNPTEFARTAAGLKGPATLETELGPVSVK